MKTAEEIKETQSNPTPSVSRRTLLGILGGGVVAGLSLSGCAGGATGTLASATIDPSEVDILNFALNLEYLEAEFYTYAVTGQGIEAIDIPTDGTGARGETINGAKVNFTDETLAAVAKELAYDEQQHVKVLRDVLGDKAIAKPAINLNGLGFGFGSEEEYLTLGRVMEDTGTSAYAGAAPLLKSAAVVAAAGRILSDEAYHMGNVRLMIAQRGIRVNPVDGKDIPPPPSGSKFFFVDDNALVITRTPDEVLAIVRPLFPDGLNGTIK